MFDDVALDLRKTLAFLLQMKRKKCRKQNRKLDPFDIHSKTETWLQNCVSSFQKLKLQKICRGANYASKCIFLHNTNYKRNLK